MSSEGCLDWEPSDCASLNPPQTCYDDGPAAVCVVPASGDSCDDARQVSLPYVVEGDDVMADFTDQHAFFGTDCPMIGAGALDAVFSITMVAGETLVVRESGSAGTGIMLQTTCGDDEKCQGSAVGDAEIRYTSDTEAVVYVTVELEASQNGYQILFDRSVSEVCDNGIDDDIDSEIDCDDEDCFEVAPCTVAETNCSDGRDNDGDSDVDCDDSDCHGLPACGPMQGVYEQFAGGRDVVDLERRPV